MTLSSKAMKGGAIALGAVLLLLVFAILPFLWQSSLREELAMQRAELDMLKARLAARNAGGSVLSEAEPLDSMFLPGSTAGTTLASFQQMVGGTAAASGLIVLRMQPIPAGEKNGLSPYSLAVDATGSLDQLRAFLASVEAMLPLVIVTDFDIGPQSTGGEDPQPYPSEDLAVSLRLEAYGWKGTP